MATLFLLVIYITFISLGLPDSLLGASWPLMRLDFGMPLDAAGIATIVISGGTIVSSLLSDRLIRRFGASWVTSFSVLATALSLLGVSLTSSFVWLIVLAIPLGLGAGAVDSALNNFVAVHYKARHLNWLHSFWGIGAFCGPLIVAFYLERGSWRGGYLTIAIIQFAVTALLFVTVPLWKRPGIVPPPMTGVQSNETDATPAKNAFKIPGVPFALFTFTFYCATEYTVGVWGSSFLVEGRGMLEADAARGVALFYVGITVGRILSGFLSARFKGPALIRTGLCMVIAGGLLFVLPLPMPLSLAALALIGLGCAPVYPSMIHETPRRFGTENSQKVVGLQMAFAYVGSTFLAPFAGFIARRTSIFVIPFFLLGYGVLMLILSETLNRIVAKNQRQMQK